jgi:indole-3-glycerol phosphate synthase
LIMDVGILQKIISEKRREIEELNRSLPIALLEEKIASRETPRDFLRAISKERLQLIAEVKKASPSRGVLCPDLDPVALGRSFAENGAAAISVLTEVNNFKGSPEYLAVIKDKVNIPLLRKDFIFDEYQIYESAAYGADALLLIVAILSKEQLTRLLKLSNKLGMDCLVEVHNERELEQALESKTKIIGINNRDLNTFEIDINTTRKLMPFVPVGISVVSESGIKSRDDIITMMECGVNAVLVGEALVTADDIPAKIKELMG